ncbi:TIR domain-containing protein [Engelhardtia mirabilis]|uniref:Putative nucleotide-binding protein containing TIR-like domain protein n=1 Tax=Engelhardtia mirabilis TaxID=2528011 RepID=A0A518BGZ4_9BACT|nr:putative nucleotide-binding protein containing TIR-like domain protein [Planctomycetes bacterium Pla133]QDV00578.1 putative nucleotide-binding protein containing TIR-like domain protein [Planctomycetes bacterium Pla86]
MKPRVFIGSSQEKRPVAEYVADQLAPTFEVYPWWNALPPSESTMEGLARLARTVDAAVLIFGADDTRGFRNSIDFVTRDNVVLEYGMFVGALARERVRAFCEGDVATPTDMAGITVAYFKSGQPHHLSALDPSIKEIADAWGRIVPREYGNPVDSGLGLAPAVFRHAKSAHSTLEAFIRSASFGDSDQRAPIAIESEVCALDAYVGGLGSVESRFWTTTYLTSGFWTRPRSERLVEANLDMLRRTSAKEGSARRLIILAAPERTELRLQVSALEHFRRIDDNPSIQQLRHAHRRLRSRISALEDAGCTTKVTYPPPSHRHGGFLAELEGFVEGDTELAIYDSKRVDLFDGGRVGRVTGVRAYTHAYALFDRILEVASTYFTDLWQSAMPASDFLLRLDEAIRYFDQRIDMKQAALGLYVDPPDQDARELKSQELQAALQLIRDSEMWGKFRSYLDIGTCTGRYPLALKRSEALDPSCRITGIDSDDDCILVAKGQCLTHEPPPMSIRIEPVDLFDTSVAELSGPFELVTAMMGTISHLAWDGDRSLRLALSRIVELLDSKGLLLLSTWTKHAVERDRIVAHLYDEVSRKRIRAWSPRLDLLQALFDQAGLEVVHQARVDTRMIVFALRRRPGRG